MELQRLEPKERRGLVLVITGHGKGKTTAALGIALRAAGWGLRVAVVQFMKGDMYYGELDGVRRLAPLVELEALGAGFCGIMGDTRPFEEHQREARHALEKAREKVESGRYEVVILDEVNNAVALKLIELEDVLALVRSKPPALHLVLTGRDASPELTRLADTVSEVREVKHAYRSGIEPQPGIDY
jgi:cob(I)alamin adenosyltransferase